MATASEGPITVPIDPEEILGDLDDTQRLELARRFGDAPTDVLDKQRTLRVIHHALARHVCVLCPAGADRDAAVDLLVQACQRATASLIV